MGVAINTMLAYGYNLSGDYYSWEVEEADEVNYYDISDHDWYQDDNFMKSANNRILAAHGFNEADKSAGYDDRRKAAQAAAGATVLEYHSYDTPRLLIAATWITVRPDSYTAIDPEALAREVADGRHDEKLRAALAVLGMTPKQDRARWLLCAHRVTYKRRR